MEMAFLPQPLEISRLMLFGVLLLAALAGGEAVRRYAQVPRITGYVIADWLGARKRARGSGGQTLADVVRAACDAWAE